MTDHIEPQYDYVPAEPSRPRRLAVVAVGIMVVVAVLAGTVGLWARHQLYPGGGGNPITVEIPSGASAGSIADLLEQKGVLRSAFLFKLWLKVKGSPNVQAGEYRFPLHANADVVLRLLKAGPLPPPALRFTVPPGLNIRQIPARIARDLPAFSVGRFAQVLAANQVRSSLQPPSAPLEGFLFPDTYEIAPGADERDALAVMVKQFDEVAAEIGLADSVKLVGVSPYQALIVASLVEKEAKVDADRAKIARVIYNRLAAGMTLGVDATLCYLKDEQPCALRVSDLERDGPYNSRLRVGLPPTPIANPARASLLAALQPESGDWLDYELDPEQPPGQHFFTASPSAFEAARGRCARAGLGCG